MSCAAPLTSAQLVQLSCLDSLFSVLFHVVSGRSTFLRASRRLLRIDLMVCPAVRPSTATASPLLHPFQGFSGGSPIAWRASGFSVRVFFILIKGLRWIPSRCCFSLDPHRGDQSRMVRPSLRKQPSFLARSGWERRRTAVFAG